MYTVPLRVDASSRVMTTSWPMSDCARSGRMGAGRMMMVSERTRVAARGRGCRGARAGRAPRRRARGSAARDAPSGARDSAPIRSARWGGSGVRGSGRASGEVGCRNARARRSRAVPASGARGARRGRVARPHRGARAGVAEAHLAPPPRRRSPRARPRRARGARSGPPSRAAFSVASAGLRRFPNARAFPPPSDAPPRAYRAAPSAARVPRAFRRFPGDRTRSARSSARATSRRAAPSAPARRDGLREISSLPAAVPADLLDRAPASDIALTRTNALRFQVSN